MYEEWTSTVTLLGGLALLVHYELKRKWKAEKPKGLSQWIDRQWPRILFTAVLVPGTATVLTDWIIKISLKFGGG